MADRLVFGLGGGVGFGFLGAVCFQASEFRWGLRLKVLAKRRPSRR